MQRVLETREPHPGLRAAGIRSKASPSTRPADLLQSAGNQAMQAVLRAGGIQAKLTVGAADDPQEHEADHVAERIMRSADDTPCSCAEYGGECKACHGKLGSLEPDTSREPQASIQRKASAPSAPHAIPRTVRSTLASAGQPLDRSTRAFFEPRFGRDFGRVRIHTGPRAAASARSIHARAYTAGSHIVFGEGQYSPDAPEGQRLLAHELTHVIQQERAPEQPVQRQGDDDSDASAPAGDPSDAGVDGGSPDQPGGAAYSRQAACVARLGGCLTTRSGGTVEPEDIARYNRDCRDREQTGYSGPDITPSEDECRQYTSGQLVDPAKIARLEGLTLQYLSRLNSGHLRLADAQRIDAALRRAYAAIQRGGGMLPAPPGAAPPPPEMRPDGPAVFIAGAAPLLATETAPAAAAAGPTLTLIQGGAGTAAGTGAAAGGVEAGTVAAGAAGTGAAASFAVVLVALAVVVAAGFVIYLIVTLTDPPVDPTIPEELDEASNEIEQTLASAKPPVLFSTPVPTTVPIPGIRRWPDQTCENNVLDALQEWMKDACNKIPGESCSPSKVSPKRLERRPCSQIRARIFAMQECLNRRQYIQDVCFGGKPDKLHQDAMDEILNGITACRALEAVNCAPGHPMADL